MLVHVCTFNIKINFEVGAPYINQNLKKGRQSCGLPSLGKTVLTSY